jgi:hypothetical protein
MGKYRLLCLIVGKGFFGYNKFPLWSADHEVELFAKKIDVMSELFTFEMAFPCMKGKSFQGIP